MKRRDFLKWIGLLPVIARQIRFEEIPQDKEMPQPLIKPTEKPALAEDEPISFGTVLNLSYSGTYAEGYPYKVKLSKRLRYAWDELKWRLRERLYGRDYWDDS